MSATPLDKKLYQQVKKEAKEKFKVWPSAYASGWLVKEYKRRGGTYANKKTKKPLERWYQEEWINVCELPKIVPCGRKTASWEDYPYCRPRKRITKQTPVTAQQLSPKEIQERCKTKKRKPQERIIVLKKNQNK